MRHFFSLCFAMKISSKKERQIKQLAQEARLRFLKRMEPFSEEIRRLYLDEFLGPTDIARALNHKITPQQIKKFLENLDLWKDQGSLHHSKIRIKKRVSKLDVEKLLHEAFLLEQKTQERAWAKVCWSKHREFRLWRAFMRGHIFIIDRNLSFFFHASPFINSKTPTSAASPLKSNFLSVIPPLRLRR